MSDTKVDTLLASWPSTMDTQGDADKMQAMVSLARELQADLAAVMSEKQESEATTPDPTTLAGKLQGNAAFLMDNYADLNIREARVVAQTLNDAAAALTAAEKRIGELEGELAEARRERDAYKTECALVTHQCLTCGVAASHPDPKLTLTGAYKDKWDSAPAEKVRKLRAEKDAAESRLSALQSAIEQKDGALRKAKAVIGDACHAIAIYGDEPPRLYHDALATVNAALSPDAAGEQADTTRDAARDTRRMDWLERHNVRVSSPRRYGEAITVFNADLDLEDEVTELRLHVDAHLPTHPDQSPAKHGEA